MKRTDLYGMIGLDKMGVPGDSFEYEVGGIDLSDEGRTFKILDEICLLEKLTPLNGRWKKLDIESASKNLMDGLRFDLAYTVDAQMSEEKAKFFLDQLLARVNRDEIECYTNMIGTPWDGKGGCMYNGLTKSLIDMAIVFVDTGKVVFTYFEADD